MHINSEMYTMCMCINSILFPRTWLLFNLNRLYFDRIISKFPVKCELVYITCISIQWILTFLFIEWMATLKNAWKLIRLFFCCFIHKLYLCCTILGNWWGFAAFNKFLWLLLLNENSMNFDFLIHWMNGDVKKCMEMNSPFLLLFHT